MFFFADILDPKAQTSITRGVSKGTYGRKLRATFFIPFRFPFLLADMLEMVSIECSLQDVGEGDVGLRGLTFIIALVVVLDSKLLACACSRKD